MCGIIYYKSLLDKTMNRQVLRHYFKQKQRGSDGFGFVGISKKKLFLFRATTVHGIKSYLNKYPLSEILFHHRLPTSTANPLRTTHPIIVSQPIYQHNYYLLHNGIIANASSLKAKHEQLGIKYVTAQQNERRRFQNSYEFNDSEALAHEVPLSVTLKSHIV